ATARAFDAHVAARLAEPEKLPERDRSPNRRLKIGWLTSDIRSHAVGAFVNPLFVHFDTARAQHVVYYNFREEDDDTRAVKPHIEIWREVTGLGDASLADLIRADEIDILIDLNGYTSHNRALVVARKAAPIQLSWLGFPGTSGLSAIDYLLIPPDPVLEKGNWCSETPWPLPDCYGIRTQDTLMDTPIEPGLPCERNDRPFTFACFNHFRKVSADCVELWRQILKATPGSHLELVAVGGKDDDTIDYFKRLFTDSGIDGERIHIRGYQSRENYFRSYNDIDLCLDPFPFNGGTTGYDSLWMGVPFVTLPGEHLAARMGRAMLNAIGLPELIARDAQDYVNLAVSLFHDHDRLRTLRAGLREKMRASPLMDVPRLARALEEAFSGMWHRYLEQTGS
ncbi:MAG: hypothetical protein LBL69_02050, partial [Zoogloeaceae bacterium]|nr:hypothetical protein [Zoogloeaceae bacterium]